MFLDLNVAWDARRAPALAELALRLGFAGIAHTVVVPGAQLVEASRGAPHRCTVAPRELMGRSEFRCGPLRDWAKGLGLDPGHGSFLQLRRLTVVVVDAAQVSAVARVAQPKVGYDVIAARPTTLEAFQLCCEKCECDIISLPLDDKFPFLLRRKDVDMFIKRGGIFEVEFAPALRDPGKRRWTLSNVEQLFFHTRGRHIMLSSAAVDTMEMRSPHDLANFAAILGLRGALAIQSVGDVPRRALQHAAMRRGCAQAVPKAPPAEPGTDVEMAG